MPTFITATHYMHTMTVEKLGVHMLDDMTRASRLCPASRYGTIHSYGLARHAISQSLPRQIKSWTAGLLGCAELELSAILARSKLNKS
jgi:hypothetical protein